MYLYFVASIFIGSKYDVDKKIVVRYPAGAGGRFVACLIESMREPKFNFEIDNFGGVHTFNDENISAVVSHSHNLLTNIALNNLNQNLYIIQITVPINLEEIVLFHFWTKCIKRFMDVNWIMEITERHIGWSDKRWALDQLTKHGFMQTDQKLRDCMLKEIRSHSDNHTSISHDRILPISYDDLIHSKEFVTMLIDFLKLENVDIDKAETKVQDYRAKQFRI